MIETPEVKVISYEPDVIGYNEPGTLTIKLFTVIKARNVQLEIKNVGNIHLEELEGLYSVSIPVQGKQFRKGNIDTTINYRSDQGKLYTRQEKLGITVTGIPWYARMLNWLGL